MSKMSQLYAELSEQAAELGFESISEAEQAGYGVDWVRGKLVDGRELAHEAWLKERDKVLESIDNAIYHNRNLNDNKRTYEQIVLQMAKDFIKKGEM